jgi:hypothetical protein
MSHRFHAGTTYKTWTFWLLFIGTTFFTLLWIVGMAASANGGSDPEATTVMGVLALMIGIPFAIIWIRTFLGRKWLVIHDDSFEFTDRNGNRTIRDEDVQALALRIEDHYKEGLLHAQSRHLTLGVDGNDVTMRLREQVSGDGTFHAFSMRLATSLKERSRTQLDAGTGITGDGWELRQDGLSIKSRDQATFLDLDAIGAVDVYDGQICIWRKGEEEPTVRFPESSLNAYTLYLVIAELLTERAGDGDEVPEYGLGRILFERKWKRSTIGLLWFLCFTGLSIGGIFLAAALSDDDFPAWAGFIPGALGLLCGWIAFEGRYKAFRCHQYGVCQQTRTRKNQMRYAEVAQFLYGATRRFVNGVYQGTDYSFQFIPYSNVEAESIWYTTTLKGADDELELLRSHISKVIGQTMWEQLQEGQTVDWTERMRLTPEGIEHTPSGFFGGKKEPVFYPWNSIRSFDMQEGYFYIWTHEQDNWVLQEEVAQLNFFPGYEVVCLVFAPSEESEANDRSWKQE